MSFWLPSFKLSKIRLLLASYLLVLTSGCGDSRTPSAFLAAPPAPVPLSERSDPADLQELLAQAGPNSPAESSGTRVQDLRTRRTGTDWPTFLGPTHDSRSTETGIRTDWAAGNLPVVWQRPLGSGYCMPVTSLGRMFIFDRHDTAAGQTGQARLTCVNAETGDELWRFEYPTDYQDYYGYDGGPRCSPVVDEDRVYIYGAAGELHCLDVRDGQLRWKLDTMERFNVQQNFFGVGSTPLIEGDLLIVHVGGSPAGVQPADFRDLEANGTAIVAFDKYTGDVVYQLGDELAGYASPVAVTLHERRYCFMFARGGLLAFEPTQGELDWHFPWRASILESVNASNPVVVGNQILISECYGPGAALIEATAEGPRLIWSDEKQRRDKSLQTHWNTAIHHEGYLYGSSGRHSNSAELRCVEFATREVRWSEPGLSRSSLLYADGHFICLSEYGELLLFQATPEQFRKVTEAQLTRDNAPAVPGLGPAKLLAYPAWAAPILSHGLLYVRGANRLVCLELIPAESP